MTQIQPQLPAVSPFDQIRRMRPDGSEYWSARELQPLQGYSKWEYFLKAIERAKTACINIGADLHGNFPEVRKNTPEQPGRPSMDYELSRFACYLVALNGDPTKPEVAAAQAYFVVKAREAETATTPVTIESVITALAELAYREHVVPFAGRTLAFQRWRTPRKGLNGFVQLTINLGLGPDGLKELGPGSAS